MDLFNMEKIYLKAAKHNIRAFLCSALLFIVFSPASILYGKSEVTTGPVDITLEPLLSSQWVCYIQENDLYIKSFSNASIKIRTGKEAAAVIVSPNLVVWDKSVLVAWVERGMGNNKIRLAKIQDDNRGFSRKDVELTESTKAASLRLLKDDKGRVYLIEITPDKQPQMAVYLSLDGGESFEKTRSAIEDADSLCNWCPVVVDDTLFMFFCINKQGRKHIAVKSFEVPSLKIKEYRDLKDVEGISFIESFKLRNSPMVVYKTIRENKFYLDGFIQRNDSWEYFAIKGAEGLDVARMDSHVWDDGRILIVFSGEDRQKFKQRIYAALSSDGGKNGEMKRLDHKEFDNTRSWLPRMAADGEKVVVVWEDTRDIRSMIRMELSEDRGKTWMGKDIAVSDAKHYALRPRISFAGGEFYIVWHQFRDDEKKSADLSMTKLS
jgi:hypothetical protein